MSAVSCVASTAMAAFGRISPVAACLLLLVSIPVVSQAQDGRCFVECVDVAHPQDTLSIVLDFDRRAVAGAFPINWAWFTGKFVLFQCVLLLAAWQRFRFPQTKSQPWMALRIVAVDDKRSAR
jgi:hypothetical protein